MNLDKLDLALKNSTEVEVVRLLTCNFNMGAFSLVEHTMSGAMAELLKNAIKFRTHLSMDSTSLDELINKIKTLTESANAVFTGSASKMCGYAGVLLQNSKTFMGTPNELVSMNEASYVIKAYPWWIRPVNKLFSTYIDQYVDKQAFFCSADFNLEELKYKTDVKSVSEDKIVLINKLVLPVVRVE